MPRSLQWTVSCLGLLAAGMATGTEASAQATAVVDPPLFEYMEGGRITGFPFGYPNRQVLRYQEIHDGLQGTARSIQSLQLRRAPSTATIPTFRANCSLRLSTATREAAKLSNDFAANTGIDVATVLKPRFLALPEDVPPPAGELAQFSYTIPTDQPFAFTGKGPLCLELLVQSHSNRTAFGFDLYQEGFAHTTSFGAACNGLDLRTTLGAAKISHQTTGLPASAPVLFLAGMPLADPIDLTALGAPGCWQLISLPIILPGFASSAGVHDLAFDPTAAQPGHSYTAQLMAIKPGINVLGAVLSQANLVLPIGARSVGRLWAETLTAKTGNAQPVYGLVLRFD